MENKLQLRDYQKDLLAFHLKHERSIDSSQPGCGKTPVMAMWIKIHNDVDGCKTIFTMPSSLLVKNRDEVLAWTGWSENEVKIVSGTPKQREKIYADSKVRCFLMTGDTYGREWEKLHELQPEINAVVVDEVHLIYPSHQSQRTQSMYRSSRVFKYFLFASGSIINGRYSSVYPMLAVIEPRFYLNYNNFLNYHAIYGNFGQIVGWGRPERLKKILATCAKGYSLKQAYPNKPENIIIPERCEMDSNLLPAYKELEEDALLELRDEYLEVNNPMVKALKCRTLLSQPETFELVNLVKINGKDEMIKTHVQNALLENKRILIFAAFREEQKRILDVVRKEGARAEIINGELSGLKRGQIAKDFEDHKLDVIIGSQKTLGVGYNFEFIKEIVFADLEYGNGDFQQALLRGSRGTRKEPLPVYILTYGTRVEKRILQIINRKEKELKKVFDN